MVYKILTPANMSDAKAIEILFDFKEEYSIDFSEVSIGEYSSCEKFCISYSFIDYSQANFFCELVKSRGYECTVEEYTKEFVSSLLESNERFNSFKDLMCDSRLIENIYENNISKDMILDKANNKGFDSLNEFDYKILKK